MTNDMLTFIPRKFPSANQVLLHGENPVLVDSGFGSDFAETVTLLRAQGIEPQALQMVLNTHWHADHSGGNHHFQREYGVQTAAHSIEAAIINQAVPEAHDAHWLVQPIERCTIDLSLQDGDVIDTGTHQWQVIHTPGHSPGHICLYRDGVLVAGDTVHADDVSWMSLLHGGWQANIRTIMNTLDTLAALPLKIAYSGHGSINENPLRRIDEALRRYEKWQANPQKIGWHAMKRIAAYYIMLTNGVDDAGMRAYLLRSPWFVDYTREIFQQEPEDMVQPMIDELLRSQATYWKEGILLPTAPFTPPPPGWTQRMMK